jgi:hypothetical protein
MQNAKRKFSIGLGVILLAVLVFAWMRWGPSTWKVQITGTTGDGREVQYRIATVLADTTDTLIFRNEDAGFFPPYFKFNSADLQSVANRITRTCPQTPVTMHGYGWRIPLLNMFPNATSIDAPQRCIDAPSKDESSPAVTTRG